MRVVRTRGRSAVLVGLLVAAGAGWLIVRTFGSEAAPPAPPPRTDAPAARPEPAAPPPAIARAQPSELGERMRQRREERRTERRAEAEPTYTTNPPGVNAGIAAFPPPGTKPVKRGIVVPDDFELPEGYVRHYQTTDDGRRLPPILMFHPDFAPVDENGNAIALPEDRIVPPELAPPGLPRRMLEETDTVDDAVGRRVHMDGESSRRH